MAVKTYLMAVGNDGNFGALVDGVDQTAASRTDGWTVAKIASGNSCEFDAGTKQISSAFTSDTTFPKPASLITGTTANAFKTPAALTGTFASGTWNFLVGVRCTTAASQAGWITVRAFRTTDAAGTGATEILPSFPPSGGGSLSTTSDASFLTQFAPGALTLTNEYLFFAMAWRISVASSSNSGDAVLRTGQASGSSNLVTPDFTVASAAVIPDVGMALTVT